MAKGNHLDNKKAKAKEEAREKARASTPVKARFTWTKVGIWALVVACVLLMLIPLLGGFFSDDSTAIDPNLNLIAPLSTMSR